MNLARKFIKKSLVSLSGLNISKLDFLLTHHFYHNAIKPSFNKHNSIIGGYEKRNLLWDKVIDHLSLSQPIIYIEFGVFKGESIRYWANKNKHAKSEFFGFDTFEGLPEEWISTGIQKGTYTAEGSLPDIKDDRVSFYKGLFAETIPQFISNHKQKLISDQVVIHFDADLYSSTVVAMSFLFPLLVGQTVYVIFDEFLVEECKAFEQFYKAFGFKFDVIAGLGLDHEHLGKVALRLTFNGTKIEM